MLVVSIPPAYAVDELLPFDVQAESAVLMDAKTGKVLYAKAPDKALPPASVTKVMTLLLVMEAIDSGKMKMTDMIPVSEYAASMGGSQVFLEAGEEMTCEDMLKSVVIASANMLRQCYRRVVCRRYNDAFEHILHRHLLALLQIDLRAAHRRSVLTCGYGVVKRKFS